MWGSPSSSHVSTNSTSSPSGRTVRRISSKRPGAAYQRPSSASMLAAPLTVKRQLGTVASSTASFAKTPTPPMEAVSTAWVNLSIGFVMAVLLMLYDVPASCVRPIAVRLRRPRGRDAPMARIAGRESDGCPVTENESVAFDEDLAARIRELVGGETGVTEKRMFGGLAFLIGGNMAISATGQRREV